MRILLIEPPKPALSIGGEDAFVFEPLALEYLAAGLERDHDVTILDMRLDRDLDGALSGTQPDVIGLTSYTIHVNVVRDLCRRLKAWNPDALTVVGGHHATVRPRDFLIPEIDLVVRGDGFETLREIVARRERGEDLAEVPGLVLPDGTETSPGEAPLCGLDAHPLPARRLTARYRARYFSEWMRPLASIRTSRGCPGRCSFCALWKIAGGQYQRRRPEAVVEELATIDESCVFFADDESLVDASRMRRLARMIASAGLRKQYFLYARSDTIARDPGLLEAWRRIGLARVFVGLESFRDRDLAAIRKGQTVRDNAAAVHILKELGVDIYASFIVRPDFDRDDFAALRRYCRELELEFATFAVLTPLPGTDFLAEVEHALLTDDPDYCDFIHTLLPTRLSLREFYDEYRRLVFHAVGARQGLRFMRRFRLRDWPDVLARARRIDGQLRRAHRDYDGCAPAARADGEAATVDRIHEIDTRSG